MYLLAYTKKNKQYIQNQINKIRDSFEDRQFRIARQTVNDVSRRKSTAKAKLKKPRSTAKAKLNMPRRTNTPMETTFR